MERVNIGHGIPVLKLAEGKFLSPFRGYSFQVSGDEEGHGDRGSSKVLGLGNVIQTKLVRGQLNSSLYASNLASDELPREIFRLMALDAIFQSNFRKEDFEYQDWWVFETFIDDCVTWVEKNTL